MLYIDPGVCIAWLYISFCFGNGIVNRNYKQASNDQLFKGLRCGFGGLLVSHFLYADDVVFVGEWKKNNVLILQRILRCFSTASGLKINLAKSLAME